MKSILNKRGQTMDLIGGTVISFVVLIFIIFAVLFGISALNPSSFFTANSASYNATLKLQNNLTTGVSAFGDYIPTVLIVLAVVLVLSAVVLLILYVRRMQGGGTGGSL